MLRARCTKRELSTRAQRNPACRFLVSFAKRLCSVHSVKKTFQVFVKNCNAALARKVNTLWISVCQPHFVSFDAIDSRSSLLVCMRPRGVANEADAADFPTARLAGSRHRNSLAAVVRGEYSCVHNVTDHISSLLRIKEGGFSRSRMSNLHKSQYTTDLQHFALLRTGQISGIRCCSKSIE